MKKTKFIALGLTGAMALSLVACGGSSKPAASTAAPAASAAAPAASAAAPAASADAIHIQWAHSSSTTDRQALAIEKMAPELAEASGGRLIIDHYPASQLGAETEEVQGVQMGTIDCAVISTGPIANFAPSVYVTSTPYYITSREVGQYVYDSQFGQDLGHKVEEEAGWKFMDWAENGLRIFSNAKHEIKTPADLQGLKIRTMENDIHMQLVNDLGGSATPIAFSELYTALQQGTVDGQENGVALTYSMGFNEVVKFMTILPHIYDPYYIMMSSDKWNSLSADDQAMFQEYVDKYVGYERAFNQQNDEEFLQKMIDDGLTVYYPTDDEAQMFIDATAGVVDMVRAKCGDELVDAYIAACDEAKAALK